MLDRLEALTVIGSYGVSTGPLFALTAAAFVEVSYSPALLLEASFSAAITDNGEFAHACGCGFESYFEEMYQVNEARTGSVFVERSYRLAEVIAFVIDNALSHKDTRFEQCFNPSVAWDAGFVLGWLSAHALVDRPIALMALEVLRSLIEPSFC